MEPTQPKSYGAVVASIIIILVLIVGALYFWGKTLDEKKAVTPEQTTEQTSTTTVTATDTIDSIGVDLNNTQDLKDVDTGLKSI